MNKSVVKIISNYRCKPFQPIAPVTLDKYETVSSLGVKLQGNITYMPLLASNASSLLKCAELGASDGLVFTLSDSGGNGEPYRGDLLQVTKTKVLCEWQFRKLRTQFTFF